MRWPARLLCLLALAGGAHGCDDATSTGLQLTLRFDDRLDDARLAQVRAITFQSTGDEDYTVTRALPSGAMRTEAVVYDPLPASQQIVIAAVAVDAEGQTIASGATDLIDLTMTNVHRADLVLEPESGTDSGMPLDAGADGPANPGGDGGDDGAIDGMPVLPDAAVDASMPNHAFSVMVTDTPGSPDPFALVITNGPSSAARIASVVVSSDQSLMYTGCWICAASGTGYTESGPSCNGTILTDKLTTTFSPGLSQGANVTVTGTIRYPTRLTSGSGKATFADGHVTTCTLGNAGLVWSCSATE